MREFIYEAIYLCGNFFMRQFYENSQGKSMGIKRVNFLCLEYHCLVP